jgi:hypothetical protein
MSSSSRNIDMRGMYRSLAWMAPALMVAGACHGQQITFTPRAQATAEYDSNPLLESRNPRSGEWYQALVGGTLDRQTLRSELELVPVFSYSKSSIRILDQWSALVDLRGRYMTQRTIYSFLLEYHRQDAYNSEYGVATYNPQNPEAPGTVGTGFIVTGIKRDNYQISPSINHTFTERLNGEIGGTFLAVRYSTQVPEQLVSFNAPSAAINAVWAFSERARIAVGPFYSEFDPLDSLQEGALKSRSYGGSIGYRYLTTRLTDSEVIAKFGRDEQYQLDGSRAGTTTWGLEWRGTYKWQTGQLQFTVGRLLEPSSVGGEIALYEARGEFAQTISQTLSAQISARASRQEGVGAQSNLPHRNRGYGTAALRKQLTREFVLTAGYKFLFQKLRPDAPLAQNHGAFITIGWQPIESR